MEKKKEEGKEVVISEVYYCGTNNGRTRLVLGLSVENIVTYDLLVCGTPLSKDVEKKLKTLDTSDICRGENLKTLIGIKLLIREDREMRGGKIYHKSTYLENLGKRELPKGSTHVFDIREETKFTVNSLMNCPDIIFKCVFTSDEYTPSFDKGDRPLEHLSYMLESMKGEENEY